ncbi:MULTISPECIES: hypothetical protein [Burkholderiaceae]|jgi:hypothetical protein|uniref:hypothetical protein n=1 Tax=Burkholderiaceae TaxID=119060 RepID=UPI001F1C6393|nr:MULTISPECIES: hypothetical protein [Burkholderiaceae]USX10770.1 hypothetical protein NHH62_29665 [Paraburkholderia fungorum]
MSDAGEAIVLPLFTNKISKEARDVRVEAMQIRHDLHASALESGSADLGLGTCPFSSPDSSSRDCSTMNTVASPRSGIANQNQDLPIDDYVQLENILVSSETLNRL